MRKTSLYFLMAIFAIPILGSYAQIAQKPKPRFTLEIYEEHGDDIPTFPYFHKIAVELTNISKEVIRESTCDSYFGMYTMTVLRDGEQVPETDQAKSLRKLRDAGKCYPGEYEIEIKPGETRQLEMVVHVFYEIGKPGAYDVTVYRETFPGDLEKNVTVKSNTITIYVREPEPGEPLWRGAVGPQ